MLVYRMKILDFLTKCVFFNILGQGLIEQIGELCSESIRNSLKNSAVFLTHEQLLTPPRSLSVLLTNHVYPHHNHPQVTSTSATKSSSSSRSTIATNRWSAPLAECRASFRSSKRRPTTTRPPAGNWTGPLSKRYSTSARK